MQHKQGGIEQVKVRSSQRQKKSSLPGDVLVPAPISSPTRQPGRNAVAARPVPTQEGECDRRRSGRSTQGEPEDSQEAPVDILQDDGTQEGPGKIDVETKKARVRSKPMSVLCRLEVLCNTLINDIPNSKSQRIYNRLVSKYENGLEVDYKWARRNASSLILYRRTRTRNQVAKHLETGAKLPPRIFPEELAFFKHELADEAYAVKKERFSAMSATMIKKRGCGNPMGRGGVARAKAFHVDDPSVATGSNPDVNLEDSEDGPEQPDVARGIEELPPDWHHPYLGVKSFMDKFMEVRGSEPSDDEIASWMKNGRPAVRPDIIVNIMRILLPTRC
ncbi:unnamed protein product [Calypogeia fissa]